MSVFRQFRDAIAFNIRFFGASAFIPFIFCIAPSYLVTSAPGILYEREAFDLALFSSSLFLGVGMSIIASKTPRGGLDGLNANARAIQVCHMLMLLTLFLFLAALEMVAFAALRTATVGSFAQHYRLRLVAALSVAFLELTVSYCSAVVLKRSVLAFLLGACSAIPVALLHFGRGFPFVDPALDMSHVPAPEVRRTVIALIITIGLCIVLAISGARLVLRTSQGRQ